MKALIRTMKGVLRKGKLAGAVVVRFLRPMGHWWVRKWKREWFQIPEFRVSGRRKREICVGLAGAAAAVAARMVTGQAVLCFIEEAAAFGFLFWVTLCTILCFHEYPDPDALDWLSMVDISARLSATANEISECDYFLKRLNQCDPAEVHDVVSAKWKSFGEQEQRSLSFLMDGEHDLEDWVALFTSVRYRRLKDLADAAGEAAAWWDYNIGGAPRRPADNTMGETDTGEERTGAD